MEYNYAVLGQKGEEVMVWRVGGGFAAVLAPGVAPVEFDLFARELGFAEPATVYEADSKESFEYLVAYSNDNPGLDPGFTAMADEGGLSVVGQWAPGFQLRDCASGA